MEALLSKSEAEKKILGLLSKNQEDDQLVISKHNAGQTINHGTRHYKPNTAETKAAEAKFNERTEGQIKHLKTIIGKLDDEIILLQSMKTSTGTQLFPGK